MVGVFIVHFSMAVVYHQRLHFKLQSLPKYEKTWTGLMYSL